MERRTIQLPRFATVGSVDRITRRELSKVAPEEVAVIDCSRCRFIEVTTLLYILAILNDRALRGLRTELELPSQRKVRDFLRTWNFFTAAAKAAEVEEERLLAARSKSYLSEETSVFGGYYGLRTITPDGRVERILRDRFFSIRSFSGSHVATDLAFREAERWNERGIKAVLTKVLHGPETYLSSRIIFESLMNAVRHPRAQLIQMASLLQSDQPEEEEESTGEGSPTSAMDARGNNLCAAPESFPEEEGKTKDEAREAGGHFTIAVWDNGESIVDTLRRALREGRELRSNLSPEFYLLYEVLIDDQEPPGEMVMEKWSSEVSILPGICDSRLLFAATLPGITRDVETTRLPFGETGGGADRDGEIGGGRQLGLIPGMGLYLLINTAVDLFGGSVSLRTGNLFLNIRASRGAGDYRVRLRRYFPATAFRGNMLTVRLPLSSRG